MMLGSQPSCAAFLRTRSHVAAPTSERARSPLSTVAMETFQALAISFIFGDLMEVAARQLNSIAASCTGNCHRVEHRQVNVPREAPQSIQLS